MGKHSEGNAEGTDAQRKAAAEKQAVETRNLREKLRREGKIQGDQSDR